MRNSLVNSFKCAFSGIAYTCVTGRNFKIQLGFAVLATVLGLAFAISPLEWAVIFVCMGVVLGGECVSTSIESVVDLVSPDYHELAGRAKDCAAGGVLVCSIASVGVAAAIFLPKMVALVLA